MFETACFPSSKLLNAHWKNTCSDWVVLICFFLLTVGWNLKFTHQYLHLLITFIDLATLQNVNSNDEYVQTYYFDY